MKLNLIAIATALLLAGCALGPTVKAPEVASPTAWSLSSGDAQPDWAGLLDPKLAALQARALDANRDIALAAQRWKQAQLLAEQSELRWLPSAGVSANASRPVETQSSTRNVEVGGVTIPVTTSTGWSRSYGASLGVGYELDLWDRLAQSTAAQRAQAEAARTDIAAARLLIRSQVAEAYWTLAAIRAQRPLAEDQLTLTRETLELTRARVREGKLLPIELDKIAVNVQAAETRLADLAADQLLQRQRLALLLDEPLPGPAPEAALPAAAPPRWRLAEPADVLAQRPDVQRARLGVDTALARLRVSEAERYPRLSFSAGLSTGGTRSSDWLSQPLASFAANLAVPLIDWQRLNLLRDGARSELDSAALTLRDTLQKALADIETQRIEADRSAQQLQANAGRLKEATENERLAKLRYDVGAISRADWLQIRSTVLDAEQTRISLRLQQWVRQAALFKALGGA
ncbi:NodT family efflux transporter outer membrane factor (OMF) lipoprotein [Pelomonas saccharophila]|uniref:NodT family efflux transporter outer membrane factor (OMF) lipoprotein n=1 Tax=Roseateles saccharophilus TaxID=304 RepID=A0ABU1YHI4_ROSSA|nr:TolC family protein [Roseateles saccharophilus]MDR7267695.1 NodT family efflux transporter outer membrane factor (OMF) lipoprotein [Roseateles saccharophilus]